MEDELQAKLDKISMELERLEKVDRTVPVGVLQGVSENVNSLTNEVKEANNVMNKKCLNDYAATKQILNGAIDNGVTYFFALLCFNIVIFYASKMLLSYYNLSDATFLAFTPVAVVDIVLLIITLRNR